MKKRIVPILTFTVALVFVAGLAYAAKKKDQSKSADRSPDPTHEEEALQAELLEATGENVVKVTSLRGADSKEIIPAPAREKAKDQLMYKHQPK